MSISYALDAKSSIACFPKETNNNQNVIFLDLRHAGYCITLMVFREETEIRNECENARADDILNFAPKIMNI